jgi:N6-adenosine-specific RNA methylase IME4
LSNPLILADPPWDFKIFDESGMQRTPGAQYPCMETAEIAALSVPAADDCVLFLWTTAPHLLQALDVMDVMKARGFEYRTNLVWTKDKIGLGFWFKNQHEHLLVGVRGDIPAPLPSCRPASVIEAVRREHSRKPDEVYELIERMYPELPKIELFARNSRPGWDAWGNQAPDDDLSIPTFLRREAAP